MYVTQSETMDPVQISVSNISTHMCASK